MLFKIIKETIKYTAIFMVFLLWFGCFSTSQFRLADETYKIRPGKIAVISGYGENATTGKASIELAKGITNRLKEKSIFKVLSQEYIISNVAQYPFSFVDINFQYINKKNKNWISQNMKMAADIFNKKTGADYILITWVNFIGSESGTYSGVLSMEIMNRLVEYPSGKVVGCYDFNSSESMFIIKDHEKAARNAIDQGVENFVENFIEKTKTAKAVDQ